MPTSAATIHVEIARPPEAVFETLTSLRSLRDRIGTSGTYAGTADVSDDPVRVGTTYVDRTPIGRVRGEVLELEADRRVVFRQALPSSALDVRITYELDPSPRGTRLSRTGEITTRGWLAAVHPVVVWATRRENGRTMERLKVALEAAADR
jgi:uncharacterized protein YndB with AHSA1/START domain